MSELRNRTYVKKEYQEDVIFNDRALVDEFLYGGSAPKDTNLPFGTKQLVEAQTEQNTIRKRKNLGMKSTLGNQLRGRREASARRKLKAKRLGKS